MCVYVCDTGVDINNCLSVPLFYDITVKAHNISGSRSTHCEVAELKYGEMFLIKCIMCNPLSVLQL